MFITGKIKFFLKNIDFIKGVTVHVEPYLNETKNSEN